MIKDEEQRNLLHNGLMIFLQKNFLFWKEISICEISNITTGWETQIISFTAKYIDENNITQNESMIIRLYQGKAGKESAKSEFQTLSSIKQTGYPVPDVYGISLENEFIDKPFLLMQKIDGKTLGAMLRENPSQYQEYFTVFIQLFLKLHEIDWRKYIKKNEEFEDSSTLFRKYFDSISKQIEQHNKKEYLPILNWLLNNIPQSSSDSSNLSFVHKDFHPENILIDYQGYVFVID